MQAITNQLPRSITRYTILLVTVFNLGMRSAQAQTLVSVGTPQVLLPPQSFGLPFFPDSALFATTIEGQKLYFAASGGRGTFGSPGTLALTGPLDHLSPLLTAQGTPIASLQRQPNSGSSAYATAFDQDYAGGGPVLWDAASGLLLHAYHAEYDMVPGQPTSFYSAIGMAVSHDKGRSFQRLGMIIRPALPPEAQQRMPSSGGTFVPVGDYLYLYYDDLSADNTCGGTPQGGLPCLAIARAAMKDTITAAAHGQTTPWLKYNNGKFNQPGIGGDFSPLFTTDPRHWVRWPDVSRDPTTGWFVLVYEAGNSGLEMRLSRDGLSWQQSIPFLATNADMALNYPSILDITSAPATSANPKEITLTIAFTAFAKNADKIDFTSRRLELVTAVLALP